MFISRTALSVAKAASDDPMRYSLTGILVDDDGSTMATDGHMLVLYIPGDQPEGEYPLLAFLDPTEDEKLRPFILPKKDALEMAKAPAVKGNPLVKNYVRVDVPETNRSDMAHVADTDLYTEHYRRIRKIDAKFPGERQNLQSSGMPLLEIGFNTATLKKFVETLTALGVEHARWSFRSPEDPVEVRSRNEITGAEMMAIVMPAKLTK